MTDNKDIRRLVRIKSNPSTPDGTFSEGETDSGFKFVVVERPWVNNLQGLSCIPRPARHACQWAWSEHHQRFLYHVFDVVGRDAIEIHSANVYEQLKGCFAPGARFEIFEAGSLHSGVPSRTMKGVIASAATLDALHADLKNKDTNEQEPFWLEIL